MGCTVEQRRVLNLCMSLYVRLQKNNTRSYTIDKKGFGQQAGPQCTPGGARDCQWLAFLCDEVARFVTKRMTTAVHATQPYCSAAAAPLLLPCKRICEPVSHI